MARATRVSSEAPGLSRAADRGRPRRRGGQPKRSTILAAQIGLGVGLLMVWELAARAGMVSTRHFSYPSEVVGRIVSMLLGESLHGRTVYEHLLATGQALAIGFLIGGSVAIVLGFVLGRSRLLNRVFEPYLLAIYSIPKIAIAPLFVLLFGIDLESKVAVVILGVFFMVFFSTLAGVMNISEEYVHIARLMGASRSQVTRRIIVPAAMPSIMVGLKMAVPFGVIGAVIGEYIAATRGIGWLIIRSTSSFDADGVFASLAFLVAATWMLGRAVALLESAVLSWQPQRRRDLVTY